MLQTRDITKKYGKTEILCGVDLTVKKGDCVAILGGNGCGKTTLLQIICGVIKADGGEVLLSDNNAKRSIGYLPQNNPLIDELSVSDNLKLWFSSMGIKGKISKNETVCRLGIDKYLRKRVSRLSGGMRRKVSLCIALASGAPLLVMDEPTTALDLVAKAELWQFLTTGYLKNGGTAIVATHDYDEIRHCNRILLMKRGRLTEIDRNTDYNEIMNLLLED